MVFLARANTRTSFPLHVTNDLDMNDASHEQQPSVGAENRLRAAMKGDRLTDAIETNQSSCLTAVARAADERLVLRSAEL